MRSKGWKKRALWAFIWLIWVALLLPLCIGALGSHPATDDYVFTGITHATWQKMHSLPHVVKDALSYALRTYRDWQGTISGVIVMCLNPAVFSPAGYGFHAPVLLAVWLGAFYAFLRAVLVYKMGFTPGTMRVTYILITLGQWIFLPSYIEGLYWHNGAWFYTGTTAILFLTLALLLRGGRAAEGFARILCAFIGLNNYVTAALACAIFTFVCIAKGFCSDAQQRRAALGRWGGALAITLILLLVSILAPGNRVRMETDAMYGGERFWFFKSLVWTARDAAGYFFRFLFKTPLCAGLALCFPFALRAGKTCRIRARFPGLATLLTYVLLCAMIFPHMFTSGYAGPGRIVDLYHHYVVTASTLLTLYWAVWAAQRGFKPHIMRGAIGGMTAFCLMLAISGAQIAGEYRHLIGEIASGSLWEYRAQTRAAYALLEAAEPEEVVEVPGETVTSVTGMQTGGPDAENWQNQALATYFDVAGVIRK